MRNVIFALVWAAIELFGKTKRRYRLNRQMRRAIGLATGLPLMAGGAQAHSPLLGGTIVGVIVPALRDNTTASVIVDTAGYQHFDVLCIVGATDIVVDCIGQHDADSAGGSPTAITGAAVTQFSATDDNKVRGFSVPEYKILERYFIAKVTIGDGVLGANVAVVVIGYPRSGVPDTRTPAGIDEFIQL